jgi:hypothetical protein
VESVMFSHLGQSTPLIISLSPFIFLCSRFYWTPMSDRREYKPYIFSHFTIIISNEQILLLLIFFFYAFYIYELVQLLILLKANYNILLVLSKSINTRSSFRKTLAYSLSRCWRKNQRPLLDLP